MSNGKQELTSPQNLPTKETPIGLQDRGKPFTRVSSLLLGYDLFISYRRADANTYALRLANQLIKLGFRCYLDQFSSPSERVLPTRVKDALRQSRGMVVVGSPGALNSAAILEELRIFSTLSRPILPINVDGTLKDESWDNLIVGLSRTDESKEALEKGRPSRQVLTRLTDSITFRRRNEQLKRTFWATLLGIALLIAAGVLTVYLFTLRIDAARKAVAEAAKAQATAENLAKVAQDNLNTTQDKLSKTSDQLATTTTNLGITTQKLTTANEQEKAATERADAETRRAELQHRVVVSQNLIARATAELKFDPETSVLLARDAFTAAPSEEAGDILRRSLLASHAKSIVEDDKGAMFTVFNSTGEYVATLETSAKIKVWKAKTGEELATLTFGAVDQEPSALKAGLSFLSFSPDGKYIAANADHDTAYLWNWQPMDLRDHPTVLRVSDNDAHETPQSCLNENCKISSIAFTPDGKYVATAGDRGKIWIWQTYSGTISRQFEAHGRSVNEIVFSPRDGRFLASAGADEKALLWDWRDPRDPNDPRFTKNVVRRLPGDTSAINAGSSAQTEFHYPVQHISFDATGAHVVTISTCSSVSPGFCSGSFPLTVYSVESGERLSRLEGHENGTLFARFSPDGHYILSAGGDNTVKVWKWEDSHLRRHPVVLDVGAMIASAEFSPNSRFIATGGWDGVVRLWQSGTGLEGRGSGDDATLKTSIAAFLGHKVGIGSVGFTPDGKQIMSTGLNDGTARLWNIELENETASIKATDDLNNAAFSPDGKHLVTTGPFESSLQVWELTASGRVANPKEIKALPNMSLSGPSFSPDGKYIIATAHNSTADIKSNLNRGAIYLWNWGEDNGSQKPPWLSPATGFVGKVEFSHDKQGRYVLGVVTDLVKTPNGMITQGEVRVWDREAPQLNVDAPIAKLGPFERLASAAFSFDPLEYIAVATDSSVRVVNWRTNAQYDLTHPHFGTYVGVAFSPDNKYVAALGNSVDVWEWQDSAGRQQPLLMDSDGLNVPFQSSIAFSPNSALMITNGQDSIARIWDVRTGSLVMRLGGETHSHPPDAQASFSSDGIRVLVTDSSAVRIYDCEECGATPAALPSFVSKHVSQRALLIGPSKPLRELNLPRTQGGKN